MTFYENHPLPYFYWRLHFPCYCENSLDLGTSKEKAPWPHLFTNTATELTPSISNCVLWLKNDTKRIQVWSHYLFDVVHLQSCVQLFVTPLTAVHQASLPFTIYWSLLKLMSVESAMPSTHLILCHPLLLPPSVFPSIRIFSKELALHIRWPRYWSFSISPSSESSKLISLKMDWFDLAVQGTLKSLLQHHRILWHSAFFIVQLSHPYMTTGKTIALTRRNFVCKVMSLLFKMLFRLVIAFLPRSKHLLISWLQSPSAVILGPKK